MHRLIMLSSAYRMSSAFRAENAARDPDNRFLWRMNRRRLDAESLPRRCPGGRRHPEPEVRRPAGPAAAVEGRALGMWDKDDWPESLDRSEHDRRSVYIFAKRQFPYPMFKTFDAPDPATSCGRRAVTTVAPQALTLLNSEFMLRSARGAGRAARIRNEPGPCR